ncbi:MAG TPA: LysR family transcriptional regulator [Candidatus Thioglobus sp.]|jgi:LysR family glycine cleavage system transcriptional activator|nr:LysR family transcriptional regulator [Candidatus Thioglobus sp.]HIL20727.1 LysR family transcriptional regulator [Candidatus Thioglobus sp.]
MRFKSYNSLRIFGTVARCESITVASEELCRSKGAVSYQINKLERELGFMLFDRTKSKLTLTDAGRNLWHVSQSSLNQIDNKVEQLRGKSSNTVTVGVLTFFASRWLSPRLANFFQDCPEISLRLEAINSIDEFNSVNFDLVILWGNAWSGFTHDLLVDSSSFLIGNPKVAKEASRLGLSQAVQTIPLLNDGFSEECGMRAWHEVAGLEYMPSSTSLTITDSSTRFQAVIDGQGVALWDKLVRSEIDTGKLVYLSDIELKDFGYHLVYHSKNSLSGAAKQFRNWIIKEVKS